tara:strand:+ start:453 stop:755 length:303 start_codon:yes stop_codon:yes gene_type:complete
MGLLVTDTVTLPTGQELSSYYVGLKDGCVTIRKGGPDFYTIEAEFGCYISQEARLNNCEPFKTINSSAVSNVATHPNMYSLLYEDFKTGFIPSSAVIEEQ